MNPGGSAERGIAARILAETETGRRLDVAWEAAGADGLENRAWLRHLVYGTVRLRGRLDHVLARFSSRPVDQLDPPVRTALRLGAFQLLYMGSVPAYAAVSESVALVKASASRGAAGLVNAVLRRVAEVERVEELFPAAETDLLGFLTSWGSHPEWLVRRWLTRFGEVATRALVEANNEEPDVYLNPVGLTSEEARRKLGKAGIDASPVPDSDSLRLPRGSRSGPRSGPGSGGHSGSGGVLGDRVRVTRSGDHRGRPVRRARWEGAGPERGRPEGGGCGSVAPEARQGP